MYEWLKAIHVLAAVAWVGSAIALQVLALRAQASKDTNQMTVLGQQAEYLGRRLLMPASIVVLIAGIWLVIDEPAWTFGQAWILFGLIAAAASAALGASFLGPESGRIAAIAADRGTSDAEYIRRLERIFLVSRIELGVLILVVIDMVVKPGL